MTQLLEVMEDITAILEDGSPIDIVYLDFKKAFDSVPHQRLLLKLKSYGIGGCVIDWLEGFLSERTQRVRVGQAYSPSAKVLSGIPQGSILGPILFTIFINDLPDCVKSCCKVFADDTKIYDKVEKRDQIQQDINCLQQWSDKWCLYFNVSKCKVMHIGKKNPKHDYIMKGQDDKDFVISECESEKDLGVTFDPQLKFDVHIQTIVNKANRMVGLIRRAFSFLNRDVLVQLYKTLVRPHLEYGNVIWYPHLKYQSVDIENVQRRATKLIPELSHLTYGERLKVLHLPSLKHRRIRGDLIQTYKILNQLDNIDRSYFFAENACDKTRNNVDKLYIQYAKTNVRKFTFSNRVAPVWNSLSHKTKTATNLNCFKNQLDTETFVKSSLYLYDE